MFLRTVIERISRGRVIKRQICIDHVNRPIYVTPDAQLKYLKPGAGSFDSDLIKIAEQYISEKSQVWDIGANVGVFTFAAASMAPAGKVVAVEADIWLADLIRSTAALKAYSDREIAVLPAAVADKNSVATFLVAARGRASNALECAGGRSQMGALERPNMCRHLPSIGCWIHSQLQTL